MADERDGKTKRQIPLPGDAARLTQYGTGWMAAVTDLSLKASYRTEPVWRNGRSVCADRYRVGSWSEARSSQLVLLYARKSGGIVRWPISLGMLIGLSPHQFSPIGRAPVQKRVPWT